jgi:hypothetical protein
VKYKIRPFTKTWEVYDSTAARSLRVAGDIRNGRFLLTIGHTEFTLPTTEPGEDRFGPFAYIEDQKIDLGLGWTVDVEPGDDDPGCRIRLAGESAVDIYFNDAGECDGGGTDTPPPKPEHELH